MSSERNYLLLIALPLLLCVSAITVSAQQSGAFTIQTWNTHFWKQSDAYAFEQYLDLYPHLKRDLVLLQEEFEVTHMSHLIVHDQRYLDACYPAAGGGFQHHWGSGLFTLTDYPLECLEDVPWNVSHGVIYDPWSQYDGFANKGFQRSRVNIGGVWFDVYNLHADAGRDSGDYVARANQFFQLAEHIYQHSRYKPLIVAGDFNLKKRSKNPIDADILDDLLEETGLRNVGYPSGEDLDYILIRGGTGIRLDATKVGNNGWLTTSDHLAVDAWLSWETDPDYDIYTLPEILSPPPGQLSGSDVRFSWDPGVYMKKHSLDVYDATSGELLSGCPPTYFDPVSGLIKLREETYCTVTGLPEDGRPLQVRLMSVVKPYQDAKVVTYEYWANDTTTPAQITNPGSSGDHLTGPEITFTWDPGVGNDLFKLEVRLKSSSGALLSSTETTATEWTVRDIPEGVNLFVTLHSRVNGLYTDNHARKYLYAGWHRPQAQNLPAVLVSPVAEQLTSTQVVFAWDEGRNASGYKLQIEHADVLFSEELGAGTLSVSVSTIPSNGEELVATLWTRYEGKESYEDPRVRAYRAPDLTPNGLPPAAPFGSFDSPVPNRSYEGSVAVTGWALDDTSVVGVKIYRDPAVFLGDAYFTAGARPDVAGLFPEYPNADQAGWGYLLLTNALSDGQHSLYAVAQDNLGNSTNLGGVTITVDNSSAAMPYGAIDTPVPGALVSGSVMVQGWALTPSPSFIPYDGSTIEVLVDDVVVGSATYGTSRPDVTAVCAGCLNVTHHEQGVYEGPGFYFSLQTSGFADGLHKLVARANDSAGNLGYFGSRWFETANGIAQDQGPLEMLYPIGHEILTVGKQEQISWTSLAAPVRISLWRDDVEVGVVADPVDGSLGSYSWPVGLLADGTVVEPAADYLMRIEESSGSGVSDTIDNPFVLADPGIRVITPNQVQSVATGQDLDISWLAPYIDRVKISLFRSGEWVKDLATDVPGADGSYRWTVGSGVDEDPGDDYTIRITQQSDTNVHAELDQSDSVFEICDPTVRVLTPNGGESLRLGTTYDITWSGGARDDLVKIVLFKENGSSWVRRIAGNLDPSLGSYSWTVGEGENGSAPLPGAGYKIVIIHSDDQSNLDWSDQSFSLTDTCSSQCGSSWTAVSNDAASVVLEDVASNGSTWVAVGWSGRAMISTDQGLSWTDSVPFPANARTILYSSALSLFVVAGDDGFIATSPDGLSWTARTSSVSNDLLQSTEGDGKLVLTGQGGVVVTSTDGVTWARVGNAGAANVSAIAYGNGKYVICSVAGWVWTSTDATTWTHRGTLDLVNAQVAVFGNGVFLIGGRTSANQQVVYRSADGTTWMQHVMTWGINTGYVRDMVFTGTEFVGIAGNRWLIHSVDGATWTNTFSPATPQSLYGIGHSCSEILAVGYMAEIVRTTCN